MIFTNRNIPYHIGNLHLNNQIIDFVSNYKFLGVYFDSALKFSIHISYICNKVSRSLGLFWKLKDFLPLVCMSKF